MVGFCLSGASPRARCEVLSADQGRGTGLDGIPAVHRDRTMKGETAHPDSTGVRAGNLLDSTGHSDEGAYDEPFSPLETNVTHILLPCLYP